MHQWKANLMKNGIRVNYRKIYFDFAISSVIFAILVKSRLFLKGRTNSNSYNVCKLYIIFKHINIRISEKFE